MPSFAARKAEETFPLNNAALQDPWVAHAIRQKHVDKYLTEAKVQTWEELITKLREEGKEEDLEKINKKIEKEMARGASLDSFLKKIAVSIQKERISKGKPILSPTEAKFQALGKLATNKRKVMNYGLKKLRDGYDQMQSDVYRKKDKAKEAARKTFKSLEDWVGGATPASTQPALPEMPNLDSLFPLEEETSSEAKANEGSI